MKLSTVDAIAGMLGSIKLTRIPDKEVKNALVGDYLQLRRLAKKAGEDAEELRKKFQADWMEEMNAVTELRSKNEPIVGHKEYLDAEADANKAIYDIYEEEVEVSLIAVPLVAFLDACEDELTLQQIAFLQDNGIIEE